jgi:hypothetical protein
MERAITAERAPILRTEPSGETAAIHFPWSHAKLRRAALILFGCGLPALVGCALSALWLKALCLVWLIALACLLHALERRIRNGAIVLSVDRRGIFDRRLLSRPIGWQEIEGSCRVDIERSHVVDFRLRWPEITLKDTRWALRVGAYCQQAYGVPAISISMLLLEGTACDLLRAVAQYRPDLLHGDNRASPTRGAFSAWP